MCYAVSRNWDPCGAEGNLNPISKDSVLDKGFKELLIFEIPPKEERQPFDSLFGRVTLATCLFLPDSSRLATCTTDGMISISNVHKCRIVQRFRWCGKQPATVWWSDEFLWIFSFVEDRPMFSWYPVDQQVHIRDSHSQANTFR